MRNAWKLLVAALALAAMTEVAVSGGKDGDDKKKFEEAFKDAMMKYGVPGPEHKLLDPLLGKWEATVKFYMKKDEKPQESKGIMERKTTLEKRFVLEHFKGDVMGQPFTGMGMVGFDRHKKKFFSIWVDSMTTIPMISQGAYDKDTKTFTFTGDFFDPYVGKEMTSKDVMKIVGDDEVYQEMFKAPKDSKGEMFKTMDITYKRVK